MNQKIINLDVSHFSFEVGLSNYRNNFLPIMHRLLHGNYINQTKMTLKFHNAEIIKKKDNSGC